AYLEFGYHQEPALRQLFAEKLPQAQATFRRDMAGHPRMVKLQFRLPLSEEDPSSFSSGPIMWYLIK
ncbi:N5-glutamine S-adenosyl-L-methionine-dependent methyltransferase, partial [Lacticaseibacillus rhamnosus MTCC 5462]